MQAQSNNKSGHKATTKAGTKQQQKQAWNDGEGVQNEESKLEMIKQAAWN